MELPGLWVVTPGVPPVVFITLTFLKARGQTCALWVKPEVGICIWGEESLRTVSGAVENKGRASTVGTAALKGVF